VLVKQGFQEHKENGVEACWHLPQCPAPWHLFGHAATARADDVPAKT